MSDLESKAHILVVDDHEDNRELLLRLLQKQGHTVAVAENGQRALELISQETFDLVLLDIMMPVMDGFEVLTKLGEEGILPNLPVVVVSAGTQMEQVVRCIELGADDYLNKPFKASLLKARINSSLEKKFLRDAQMRTQKALQSVNRRMRNELVEAADYVRAILPFPLQGEVATEWQFLPSIHLGGDSFGYSWIDENHLIMYLLDVCGHGIGAALLSIAVMNTLNSHSTNDTDFLDPVSVFSALNRIYPMEKHNGKFFTLWYGVYDKRDSSLVYSSGGHPPGILISANNTQRILKTPGPSIGLFSGASFVSERITIEKPSKLMLFSDGVYENLKLDGSVLTQEEFIKQVEMMPWDTPSESILRTMRILCPFPFEDDFSLLHITFQE